MRLSSKCLRWIVCATLTVASTSCCTLPITRTFGLADNFAPVPNDPIPYTPALPQFVSFLGSSGIQAGSLTTFDQVTADRHMVATLRHGLRSCFPTATSLSLCFRARAVTPSTSNNDSVVIYNANLTTNTFTPIFTGSIAPGLTATWNPGATAQLCINLTPQMTSGQVGDVLMFRIQDDTAVDVITMTLQ